MPRRTAESSKAIRLAWENEQKLVLDGKGTRDWTPEQQQSIIEKGKAYDDNGKAFEGHHMKSAEAHPEFQSYPDNIEFLTRSEHKDAHGGNFQNPTNGYYDPITLETTAFSDSAYNPCKIIELSSPIQRESTGVDIEKYDDIDQNKVENYESEPKLVVSKNNMVSGTTKVNMRRLPKFSERKSTAKWYSKDIKKVGSKVLKFMQKHPVFTASVLLTLSTAAKLASGQNSNTSSSGDSQKSLQDKFLYDHVTPDTEGNISTPGHDDCDEEKSRGYPDERPLPKEHTVPGHGQHYHTKDGVIWKEKEPYKRGKKSDDN